VVDITKRQFKENMPRFRQKDISPPFYVFAARFKKLPNKFLVWNHDWFDFVPAEDFLLDYHCSNQEARDLLALYKERDACT